jgi:hypothetical protein
MYHEAANGAEAEDVLLADPVNNKYATSWSSNGRFILYHIGNANSPTGNDLWVFDVSAENKVVAVAVNGQGSAFDVGAAHPLFEIRRRPARYRGISAGNYDVSGDGQRFLNNAAVAGQMATAPITLIVNWPELLKK